MEVQLVTANCRLSWEEEEQLKRMTLQVCLIGRDGFVLASDRKATTIGGGAKNASFMTGKIYCNHDWRAAWCAAGQPAVNKLCQRLEDVLRESGENPSMAALDGLICKTVGEYLSKTTLDERENGRILFAIQEERETKGRWIDVGAASALYGLPYSTSFTDKQYAGDLANSAIFFAEEYYRATATVSALIPLAAHTILSGAKLNPTGIGGLDIVVSQSGTIRELSKTTVRKLAVRSAKLDKLLAHELLQPVA